LVSPLRIRAQFPYARIVLSADRPPATFRSQVHSSELDLPFRVPSLRFPLASLSGASPPARVSSLIATSPLRVHCHEGYQAFVTFRPQAISASRRFTPRFGSAGLFHPTAASRAPLVQGLLARRSHPSSSEGDSPLVVRTRPLTGRNRCPRSRSSTSRSLSASSSVPMVRRLAWPRVAPLFEFLLLQVSSFSPSALAYPEHSTHKIIEQILHLHTHLVRSSSAFPDEKSGQPVSEFANLPENFEPTHQLFCLTALLFLSEAPCAPDRS
jgi:hypothetical protein